MVHLESSRLARPQTTVFILYSHRNKLLIRGHSSKTREKIARTCRILWVDCTIFSVLHALRSFARFNRTLCLKVVRLFFESIQILKINLYCWHDFFSKLISIAAYSDWWYEWRLGPSLRWSQIKSYFLTCSLS